MIITLVIDTFNINNNGTTISAMRFAEALAARGHKIRVVTCGNQEESGTDPDTGHEMYYVPELVIPLATRLAHKQNTLFARPVRSVLYDAISGSDVVHIYEPWPLGAAAGRIAKRLKVPVVAAFHIQPENITYNIGLGWFPPAAHLVYFLLYILFYRRFRHIHCPSKFIAAQLRSHGYKAWLHVISNGVHPTFTYREKKEPDTDNPDGIIKILMIGRLSPEKRQDVLIKASRISKYADRIQLYFAGCGPWERKLKKMGSRLVHPPVFGYYDRQELIELIHSCNLYVHTSDVEIEGISCMEAFSCGLVPIISDSKKSATVQFALSGDNLFKSGDPYSLAAKIDEWLDNKEKLKQAGERYSEYGKEYALNQSVRQMEHVYKALSGRKKNRYYHGRLFRFGSTLFYKAIAIPLLYIWLYLFMGVRIRGRENLRNLSGALTLCNHVHTLDSVLIGIALYPRKVVFPTIPSNLNTLFPGLLVRLLGGVEVPQDVKELQTFFDEMEFLLVKGRIVHFFPEGELIKYYTGLRQFKRGAFLLAAKAHVPLVPMSIVFRNPRGLRRLIRKKPVMVLNIGKPLYPDGMCTSKDLEVRMVKAQEQMEKLIRMKAVK